MTLAADPGERAVLPGMSRRSRVASDSGTTVSCSGHAAGTRPNRETGGMTNGEPWPTPDQVLAALDAAGHLLEQQVATQLADLGYSVATSRAFTDSDEGKSRELDVYAHKEVLRRDDKRLRVAIHLLVECKNTLAPLAFLTRPVRDPVRPPEEVLITLHSLEEEYAENGRTYIRRVPTFDALGLREKYWGTASPVRAVHVSRLDRKGGSWNAANTGVFDSLTWPMAKAIRAFKAPWRNPNRGFDASSDWSHILVFVPIVVVASKLYVADGTSPAPTVSEKPFVRFQREFKAKDFQGVFGIDFVQRDALVTFVRDVVGGFGDEVLHRAESNVDALIPADKWPMWTDW
jgi:hypothetical protein